MFFFSSLLSFVRFDREEPLWAPPGELASPTWPAYTDKDERQTADNRQVTATTTKKAHTQTHSHRLIDRPGVLLKTSRALSVRLVSLGAGCATEADIYYLLRIILPKMHPRAGRRRRRRHRRRQPSQPRRHRPPPVDVVALAATLIMIDFVFCSRTFP